jgi:hypothetical protein
MLPLSAAIAPISSLIVVVLPEPLGPSRPIMSPDLTVNDKSLMTGFLSKPLQTLANTISIKLLSLSVTV